MTIEQEIIEQLARYEARFRYEGLPTHMWGGVKRYLEHGVPPGHFLQAVITNDLKECVARADDQNVNLLPNYMRFFYSCVPIGAWGSPKKYDAWIARGGFSGGDK